MAGRDGDGPVFLFFHFSSAAATDHEQLDG